MTRALMCGDRKWTCNQCPTDWLQAHPDVNLVIEGEARGADVASATAARRLGIAVHPYPAQWDHYGLAAGPIRNTQMLKEGKPHLAVAFHNDLASSKGTKNMVAQLQRAGIPVEVIVCPHR